jgi:hypothetical protein
MNRKISFCLAVFTFFLNGCATTEKIENPSASTVEVTKPVSPEPPVSVPAVVPKSNEGYSGTSAVQPTVPIEPPKITAEQLLQEGTTLYDKGDYRNAIRKLTSAKDTADEGSAVKASSLRLLAFSYCVSNQRALCKQQFTTLLAMDPNFQLSRGEAGHPLWGPVFREAVVASKPSAAPANKKK